MCNLMAAQVLAGAMNKAKGDKEVTLSQLVRFNNLLLKRIPSYYNTIDLADLAFEISSMAREFKIVVNENYETVIKLSDRRDFDYSLYERTFPQAVVSALKEIDLPE